MLHVAARSAHTRSDVKRPLPSGLIGGAPDRHAADLHDLELSFFESPNFIRLLESFQYDVNWRHEDQSFELLAKASVQHLAWVVNISRVAKR
jgi:hypothetical protein